MKTLDNTQMENVSGGRLRDWILKRLPTPILIPTPLPIPLPTPSPVPVPVPLPIPGPIVLMGLK